MLKKLNLFWGVPATVLGAGVVAVVWIPEVSEPVAYGIGKVLLAGRLWVKRCANCAVVGWGVPPLWVGLWVVITIQWVQGSLRNEKEEWCKHGTIC